jgi:hypothetical protein
MSKEEMIRFMSGADELEALSHELEGIKSAAPEIIDDLTA